MIHPTAIVYPCVKLGENVRVMEYTILGGMGHIVKDNVFVDSTKGIVIGSNTFIGGQTTVHRGSTRDTEIGDYVNIGYQCMIGHDAKIGSKTIMLPCASMHGFSVVGEGCEIGAGARIRDGVTVGNGSLIGMGSVVTKDISPNMIAYGNPAREIRKRFGPEAFIQRQFKGIFK